ncbi:type II toxin-antitoxin system RelE/ParE family toxin [Bacteroides fragilis]
MKYNKDKQSVAKKCTLLLNTIYYIAWTIRAQKRVIEILEYSQQEFGNKAADRLARTIEQKTLQLINNPFRGPVELILAKEKQISCRYLLVNPYKIIYYVDEKEETIFIVTLFHTHQHPSKLNREVGL